MILGVLVTRKGSQLVAEVRVARQQQDGLRAARAHDRPPSHRRSLPAAERV